MTFKLISKCINDKSTLFPRWVADPDVKCRAVRENSRLAGILVVDRDSAAQAFANYLARLMYGRRAEARGVRADGISNGGDGVFYCASIGCEDGDGRYRGEATVSWSSRNSSSRPQRHAGNAPGRCPRVSI